MILPGGESTAIGKLMVAYGLVEPLRERIAAGMATWGTCAGLILLAKETDNALLGQPLLATMDIRVRRNAFGTQRESFETELAIPALGERPVHAVFIRAPLIESVGAGVEILGRLERCAGRRWREHRRGATGTSAGNSVPSGGDGRSSFSLLFPHYGAREPEGRQAGKQADIRLTRHRGYPWLCAKRILWEVREASKGHTRGLHRRMIRPVLNVDLPGIVHALDTRARARQGAFANFVVAPDIEEATERPRRPPQRHPPHHPQRAHVDLRGSLASPWSCAGPAASRRAGMGSRLSRRHHPES